MKEKLGIIFLYHKEDRLTLHHLDKLKESNPHTRIVPVTYNTTASIPNSIDVGKFRMDWTIRSPWSNIDSIFYLWFKNREFDAEKYVVIEYDVFCSVDLIKHFASVWDSDVAGADFFSKSENPSWSHFTDGNLARLPVGDIQYASGMVPTACALFSHDALKKIVDHSYRNDCFSELRLGTLIRKLGLNFKRLPLQIRSTICWHNYPWQLNRPGLYHSVKSLNHNLGKKPQPRIVSAYLRDILRSMVHSRRLISSPKFLLDKYLKNKGTKPVL